MDMLPNNAIAVALLRMVGSETKGRSERSALKPTPRGRSVLKPKTPLGGGLRNRAPGG